MCFGPFTCRFRICRLLDIAALAIALGAGMALMRFNATLMLVLAVAQRWRGVAVIYWTLKGVSRTGWRPTVRARCG
jgi:hypothetical protein